MTDVLTPTDVADRLGMARETVYRLLARGEFPIPALRIGGRWKFSRAAVDRYLEGAA